MKRNHTLFVTAILLLFAIFVAVRHRHVLGEDLSSSFVGCKLLTIGQGSHLYSHDPVLFTDVSDPVWEQTAVHFGFAPARLSRLLHPYVQTPLWAYSLQPLCRRTNFSQFNAVFAAVLAFCAAGLIWLVARFWARRLFHPLPIALICIAVSLFQPFKYALFLNQTHLIFVLMTVAALILAERRNEGLAGFLLACAAAVKLTPGLLMVYWLITGKRKAAASFVGVFCLLTGLTFLAMGRAMFFAYLHELQWISGVLLIAFNNQSLAGWWMGRHLGREALFDFTIYTLPTALKTLSSALAVLVAVIGGVLDRQSMEQQRKHPPYGAIFALLGATMFTPIAWTHYYIVLIVPLMLLADAGLRYRSWFILGLTFLVYCLNLYPISGESVLLIFRRVSLVHSHFYSGWIALAGLLLLTAQAKQKAQMTRHA